MATSARSDPLSQVDARGRTRPEIGRSALNRPVYSPYRPSVLSQASDFTDLADSPEIQPEVIIPVPEGMAFATNSDTKQLKLTVDPMCARRFRRVSGYAGGGVNFPRRKRLGALDPIPFLFRYYSLESFY